MGTLIFERKFGNLLATFLCNTMKLHSRKTIVKSMFSDA